MAKNFTNAFMTVEPTRGSLSDVIVQQDQLNSRQQEERRREQMYQEQQKEKAFARDEKLRERLLQVPQNYDTGSGSLNELQGRIIQQAVNRKGEIYNKLRNGNISDSERVKLEIENKNLDSLPSNLKVATGNFSKLIEDYKKGVDSGSFFRNPDFETKVLNGYDNYLGAIDENGFPLVGFTDKNGDGKMDLMSWDNLQQGQGVWDFQPKLNYDKMVSEAAKGLGVIETESQKGLTTTKTKGIPVDRALNMANSMMYGSDGQLTDFTKSRLRELGYDLSNPGEDVLKSINADIAERIVMSKDSSNKETFDHGSAIGYANLNEKRKENAKGKAAESGIGEAVEPTEGTWKSFYNSIPDGIKSVPITNPKTKFNSLKSKDKTYSNVTIDNYSYDKKGEILISGSFPKKEAIAGEFGLSEGTSNENERVRMRGNKEIESRLAKMEGVSIEELRERAGFTEQNMSSREKETISW